MNLKILFRSLLKNRLNSSVILISLSVGIACTNLIGTFIFRELNTDSFHKNSSHIFALQGDDPWGNNTKMYHCRDGSAEYMKNNFSEVEDFCRLNNATSNKVVVNQEAYYDRPPIIAASENFFRFFSFNLLTNNPQTALETKNNIVISDNLAKKYFGVDNPMGKTIELSTRKGMKQYVVSGVFQKPENNTQFNFEMVHLINKGDSRCYLQLAPNTNVTKLEEIFEKNKSKIPVIHGGTPGTYYLKPLKDAYFDTARSSFTEASRDKADLWISLVIALLILGIATFNYLGLLNNSITEKTKEFAIRKVNGGTKHLFIKRILVENLFIVVFAFTISFLIMILISSFFNQLTGAEVQIVHLLKPINIIGYLSIILVLGFISYVFIYMQLNSNISVDSLKSGKNISGKRTQLPVFNILQLAGSVALIICSIIIMKQMNYISNKPLGMDRDVIEVKIPGSYGNISSVFKEELQKYSSIQKVTRTSASPVLEHFLLLLKYQENGIEKQYTPSGFSGDEHFISTLGIQLVAGSNFSGNPTADKNKVLINESMAKLFSDKDLIGAKMPGNAKKTICGIVKDFHYSNLKNNIQEAYIGYGDQGRHLMIKPNENQQQQVNVAIAKIWDKLIPDYPLNTETIGERYRWMHRENENYIKLIGACCLISVFLSMIGLFAIAYQNSQHRTKEIGIRKVNGAKVSEVLAMLNKDFVQWVIIAFVIATPIAYYAMNKWLENFAYKTELSWWIFALAGVLALGIALLTVSWQSWKAATRNPVEALRYE